MPSHKARCHGWGKKKKRVVRKQSQSRTALIYRIFLTPLGGFDLPSSIASSPSSAPSVPIPAVSCTVANSRMNTKSFSTIFQKYRYQIYPGVVSSFLPSPSLPFLLSCSPRPFSCECLRECRFLFLFCFPISVIAFILALPLSSFSWLFIPSFSTFGCVYFVTTPGFLVGQLMLQN